MMKLSHVFCSRPEIISTEGSALLVTYHVDDGLGPILLHSPANSSSLHSDRATSSRADTKWAEDERAAAAQYAINLLWRRSDSSSASRGRQSESGTTTQGASRFHGISNREPPPTAESPQTPIKLDSHMKKTLQMTAPGTKEQVS